MVKEFIEGWDLMQILGEGSFGEVKLLVNKTNGEACAMKEINLDAHPDAEEAVRKEICVHKLLKNKHIIQCYGSRSEGRRQFIFLEYCSGGELFDRIEPDRGMPEFMAQRFFKHLIAGVDYLHKKGVSHRDIKPENLLLDEQDVLKISDFGMATVFRHQGKERLLERRCGTLPYIAPEILVKSQYNAEPADIWSCGVVLVTMLTGELPWDQATSDQVEYMNWKDLKFSINPWKKVDNLALSLLRKILTPHPSRRYKLEQIQNHIWMKKRFRELDAANRPASEDEENEENTETENDKRMRAEKEDASGRPHCNQALARPLKRLCSNVEQGSSGEAACEATDNNVAACARTSLSQPAAALGAHEASPDADPPEIFHGFTQPAQMENHYLSTQGATQGSQTPLQRMVKRMTRFWVRTDITATELHLRDLFEKLHYTCKMTQPGILTVFTTDRRGMQLVFKTTLIEMEKQVLLDFRLSKGDGIEFKRRFADIRLNMEDLIIKAPIIWSLAIHSGTLPGV